MVRPSPPERLAPAFDQRPPRAGAAEPPRPIEPRREHAAFADVYAQHFDLVWRSLRHLGVPSQLQDDAVQDVWLVVHRKLPEFDGRSTLGTWLFGICINVARARRRIRDVSRPPEPLPDDLESHDPGPEHALESRRVWQLVQRFLAELPELHRAIFVSNLLLNFTPAETASATGEDVGTIYKRVRSLRRSFQRWIERRQEESR